MLSSLVFYGTGMGAFFRFIVKKEVHMSQQTQSKETTAKWSGSLGFIMAAAGSAVGMGNL